MQFWTLDKIKATAIASHHAGEEIAPGVTITRRKLLRVGLAGTATLLAAGCSSPARKPKLGSEPQSLSLGPLLGQLRPEAKRLIASDAPDEGAYLVLVSSLLARYQPEDPWNLREPEEGRYSMSAAAWTPPVVVYDIHMRPGASIDLHDHRHYNGVIQCTQGSVRCRNFDIVQPDGQALEIAAGEVPTGEDFLIRQNKDVILQRGQVSSLARDRDNIHAVEAGPEGCKLVDVFTYFRPEARSYGIEWDGKPVTRGGDTYRVAWTS